MWRAMVASNSSRRMATRSRGPKRDALMRKQDLKPLARDRSAAACFKKSEQVHAALRPNRRVKKVFFSSGIATGAVVSPPRRRAASR